MDTSRQLSGITPELKKEWWGDGEWVSEPDYAEFEVVGLKCKVVRIVSGEEGPFAFGGWLCGYVRLPEGITMTDGDESMLCLDVHGGVTFSGLEEDGFWIGFDCAHGGDYSPSIERAKREFTTGFGRLKEEMQRKYPGSDHGGFFNPVYKNWDFAINQCRSLAEQLALKYING